MFVALVWGWVVLRLSLLCVSCLIVLACCFSFCLQLFVFCLGLCFSLIGLCSCGLVLVVVNV